MEHRDIQQGMSRTGATEEKLIYLTHEKLYMICIYIYINSFIYACIHVSILYVINQHLYTYLNMDHTFF